MHGEALKCDNCGEIEFLPEEKLPSKLARLMLDDDIQVERPFSWFAVKNSIYNEEEQTNDMITKHFCSLPCLQFATQYTYNKKEG